MPSPPQVSFYRDAPQRCVSLEEFEELGLSRVKLLSQLCAQWGTFSPLNPPQTVLSEVNSSEDADLLSHYALRLAFCRVSSDWDWLVAAETKLLCCRLGCLPPYAAVALLAAEGIKYQVLDAEKITSINWDQKFLSDNIQRSIYQVPFTQVPSLVRRRGVVISKGDCMVPLRSMGHVATHHFKCALEQQMRDLQRAIPAQGPELDRLMPILDKFVEKANALTGARRTTQDRVQLKVADIDRVAYKHFPLCMQQLHRKMRENHHLKYDGRVQYRMFLKGTGISVHDCIQFFRDEFIKKIPPAKFDKEYTYHIRHSYGLEGSRKDYTPFGCEQIIAGGAPSHGQYHGCPFKHWGRPALQEELRRQGLSLQTAMEITQQAAIGQCQQACKMFFEASHPSMPSYVQLAANRVHFNHQDANAGSGHGLSSNIVMHPNVYFDASMLAAVDAS